LPKVKLKKDRPTPEIRTGSAETPAVVGRRDKFDPARQAWLSLVFWLSFGLLWEGLIGFRIPIYLTDTVRRELFRLAHVHGTVLSLVLMLAVIWVDGYLIARPMPAIRALQIGSVLMPLGFLLGGIWHYESDPSVLVFLAPIGGLFVIFGIITITLSNRKSQ